MASRKRGAKRSSIAQDTPIPEEDEEAFTSSAGFDFGGPAASPRMTRARRASMSFDAPARPGKRMSLAPAMARLKEEAAPRPANRRRSLAVTVNEPPKPAAGRRRSIAVPAKKGPATLRNAKKTAVVLEADEEDLEFIFDPTPSRDITPAAGPRAPGTPAKGMRPASFYSSPVKAPVKGSLANPLAVSPQKVAAATSPTKKFAKNTTRILSDEAIAESLMSAGRVPAKARAVGPVKKPLKQAAGPVSPSKKVIGRKSLSQQDIEASLMAEFDRTPTDARILPKTFETDIPRDKVKPRRREVAIQSPVVAAFREKESKPKGSRIPVKSPPVTPVKAFVPQILPAGSPVITAIMKEVRKVEVRLTPHRIKEDPNIIFSLLEAEHLSKDRVERVVQELVARTHQMKAKTRKSLDAESPRVVKVSVPDTPKKAKVGRPAKAKPEVVSPVVEKTEAVQTKKIVTKTVVPPMEETPKAKLGRPPKAKAAEKTPVVKESKTPKTEKSPKARLGRPPKTPAVKESKTPKAEEPVKPVETPKAKLGRPPKVTPAVKRPLEAAHTPGSPTKRLRAGEPEPKFKSARKSAPKVTPLKARYTKPDENLSALKKPLKRLTKAAAVTPAQVKPSDLLRKNLRRQVETAITAKVAARPDSSPYTMDTTENNSPVFRKVEREAAAVKQHLTGTPARAQPPRTRKFGTGLQPSGLALLDRSELPSEGKRQSVSSSTPLRPAACPPSPHPLEAVEATPIRPPPTAAQALSPPPQMVTGGLGKMCAIM